MKRVAGSTAFVALIAATSVAHAQSMTPPITAVCDEAGVVQKARLVTWLFDAAGVSRGPEDWAATASGASASTARERVLIPDRFCPSDYAELPSGTGSGPVPDAGVCDDGDAEALRQARQSLNAMILGLVGGYDGVDSPSREAFLTDSNAVMRCRADDVIPPVTAGFELPVRLRASTDSLGIAHGDPDLASAGGAAFSYARDDVKNKMTEKMSLVIGWPIALGEHDGTAFEAVPYAAINRDLSQVRGEEASVTSDTYQLGVAFNATVRTGEGRERIVAHRFSIRPDFMRNEDENSEVGSLTASWMPVINGRLNDFTPFAGERFLYWKPILDIRAVHGEFLALGSRAPETTEDFTRMGGQLGLAFSSSDPRWPIEFVATDTWMPALRGRDDLEYREARLSWILDKEQKIFTVDLVYGAGRRTDLDVEADGWKISLGAKY